jgi:hypothetical protein
MKRTVQRAWDASGRSDELDWVYFIRVGVSCCRRSRGRITELIQVKRESQPRHGIPSIHHMHDAQITQPAGAMSIAGRRKIMRRRAAVAGAGEERHRLVCASRHYGVPLGQEAQTPPK